MLARLYIEALLVDEEAADAIASPFQYGQPQIWTQSHPGGMGRANRNRGGVNRVSKDWAAMADEFFRAA